MQHFQSLASSAATTQHPLAPLCPLPSSLISLASERSRFCKAGDRLARQAEDPRQHLITMSTDSGNVALYGCRRTGHFPRRIYAHELAGFVRDCSERAALQQMRIAQRRAWIAIFGTGNAGLVERSHALAHRVPLGPRLDDLHHRSPVRTTPRYGLEARVIGQFALPRHLAERGKVSRCDWRNQDVAVEGAHRAVGRPRRADRELRLLQFVDQQVQHAVHQGHIDPLADPRSRALDHRGLDRRVAEDRAKHVVAEAKTVHHTRPEILDQNVGLLDQLVHQLDCVGALQVEGEAALSRIKLTEIGAVAVPERRPQTHVIALGRLDLDYLRADIGEQPCTIRARQYDRKIEHAHAGEWRGRGFLLLHAICSYLDNPSPRWAMRLRWISLVPMLMTHISE